MEFLKRLLGLQKSSNNAFLSDSGEPSINLVLYLGSSPADQPSASEILVFMRKLQRTNKREVLQWIPTQGRLVFEDQTMSLINRSSSQLIFRFRLSNIVVSCVYAKDQKILALFYHNDDVFTSRNRQTGLECHIFQCASKLHARTLAEKISSSIMTSYLQRQKAIDNPQSNLTLARYVTYDNLDEEYMPSDKLKRKQFKKLKSPRGNRRASKDSNTSTEKSFQRMIDDSCGGNYSTDSTFDSSMAARCYLGVTPTVADNNYSDNSLYCKEMDSSRLSKASKREESAFVSSEASSSSKDLKQRLQCQRLRHWRTLNEDLDLSDSSTSTCNHGRSARIILPFKEPVRRDSIDADVSTIDDSTVEESGKSCRDLQDIEIPTIVSNPRSRDSCMAKPCRVTTIKRESKSERQRKTRRNRDSNRSKSFTASETLNHIPLQTLSWYGQRAVGDFELSDLGSNHSFDSVEDKSNDYVKLAKLPGYESLSYPPAQRAEAEKKETSLPPQSTLVSPSADHIIVNPLETVPCTDMESLGASTGAGSSSCTAHSTRSDLGGSYDSGLETPQPRRKNLVLEKSNTGALQVKGQLKLDKTNLRKLKNLSETNI